MVESDFGQRSWIVLFTLCLGIVRPEVSSVVIEFSKIKSESENLRVRVKYHHTQICLCHSLLYDSQYDVETFLNQM